MMAPSYMICSNSKLISKCFDTAVEFNASHPADWVDPLNWCPTDTEGGACKQLALLDSEKIPCRTDDVVFPTGSSYYISLGSGLNLNVRTLKLSGKVKCELIY